MRAEKDFYADKYKNWDYRESGQRRSGGRIRLLALVLLVLIAGGGLFMGRLGLPVVGGGPDLDNTSAALGYGWPRRFSADSEGLFYWQRRQQELAEAAAQIQVAVYCTHSSESYTSYSGQPKVYGELGGVYRGAAALKAGLEAAGFGVAVDETIHDWPDWNKAYSNSLQTAERLLAAYPELKILIDLHRDAGVSRESSVAEINGRSAARIMLVCGSNQRYNNDNWQQNKAFMEEIAAKMEELYPGLLRRVAVQAGRYNQHLSPRAILIELGSTENTIEEVEYSGRLLAEVLRQVLQEQG